MSVAVSGTRAPLTRAWEQTIRAELAKYSEMTLHVGDCPTGVDLFVRGMGWPDGRLQVFVADWNGGPSAGPIRNGKMLRGCEVLIAFPAEGSRGTLNAIEQAIRAGIETHVYPLRTK